MRKTRTKNIKNRKRTTLAKIRRKLYSKRKGRGIGASKCLPKVNSARLETVFDDGGVRVNLDVDWVEEETKKDAKQEYKWRLDHALAFNKDIIALRDSALIRLEKKALANDRSMNSHEEKEEVSTRINSRIAQLVENRKYAEFAKNYNIMLLKRFASQQSIDYEGLLADFNENPDFEILRMAPSYDKWARESA
jgi:hypothetical protein